MISRIQVLRFWAALLVVLYHLVPRAGIEGDDIQATLVDVINLVGYAGVDIFFVISGFIMWVTTVRRWGGRDAVNFLAKRYTRIYSGYWPFFLLMWLFLASVHPSQLVEREFLGSSLLINLDWRTNVVPVAWTLVYELYFYSVFTLLVWRFGPASRIWAVAAILILIPLFHWVATPLGLGEARGGQAVIGFFASWYCAEFFLGVVAGWIYSGSSISVRPHLAPFVLLVAGLLVGAAIWYQWAVLSAAFGEAELGLRVTLFGLAGMCLVLALAWSERGGHPRIHGLYEVLGGASYSIYLSHLLIIGVFGFLLDLLGWEPAQKLRILMLLFLVVGYSLLHYRWIERPLLARSYAGLAHIGLIRSTSIGR